MNDDFYINAPVTISDFVDVKSLRVKPSFKDTRIDKRESPEVRKMAYTAANINNQNLLKKLGILKKRRAHYLAHVGYIQDKSVWEKIMKIPEVAEHQKETSKRRFRNNKDLWFPGLATLYDHAQDGSSESSLKPCYIETKDAETLKKRIHKCIVNEKTRGKYQMLCINDVLDNDQQESYKLIQSTLKKTWPTRSISEKNDYHPDSSPERADPDVRCVWRYARYMGCESMTKAFVE